MGGRSLSCRIETEPGACTRCPRWAAIHAACSPRRRKEGAQGGGAPPWSANGAEIAISERDADGNFVTVVTKSTLETRRVSLPEHGGRPCSDLRWSPDGRTLMSRAGVLTKSLSFGWLGGANRSNGRVHKRLESFLVRGWEHSVFRVEPRRDDGCLAATYGHGWKAGGYARAGYVGARDPLGVIFS